MNRRVAIALGLVLVVVVLLVSRCDIVVDTGPGPAPTPASDEASDPPAVVPDPLSAEDPEADSPDAMVRRSGRIVRIAGEVRTTYEVFITGPGLVRMMNTLREAGQEVVAGELRAMRLEEGLLPPAWKVGETAPDGHFEASWSAEVVGRVDVLFVYEDAEGVLRVRHRIEGAEAALPDEVRIPKTGSIEGRIRGLDGKPVEKALVYCLPLDVVVPGDPGIFSRRATPFTGLFLVDWARYARTGKDGRYRIGGLRPAPYRVFARRRDRGGEIRRVDVDSGKPNVDRDVVLDIEGAYVRGLVADAKTSDPVPGCLVAADDPQGTTMSNQDGTFRIGPLAPGEFRGFILKTDYEMSPLGPFELVEGRTFVAPTVYLRKKPD